MVFEWADDPRGRAGDQGARRHITGHDRAGGDQCFLANGHAGQDGGAGADGRAAADARGRAGPLAVALGRTVAIGGPRPEIVDEHHAVRDKHFIFNGYAFTDEAVALDLAARPDDGIFLNLDERADQCVIADGAAVEIAEAGQLDIFTKLHVVGDSQCGIGMIHRC